MKAETRKKVAFLGLIGVVVIAYFLESAKDNGDSVNESSMDGKIEAYTICKQFVRDRLKTPSSAEFSGKILERTEKNNRNSRSSRFRVKSYVDSENSFGANVRRQFTCVVEPKAGADSWRLKKLEFRK